MVGLVDSVIGAGGPFPGAPVAVAVSNPSAAPYVVARPSTVAGRTENGSTVTPPRATLIPAASTLADRYRTPPGSAGSGRVKSSFLVWLSTILAIGSSAGWLPPSTLTNRGTSVSVPPSSRGSVTMVSGMLPISGRVRVLEIPSSPFSTS